MPETRITKISQEINLSSQNLSLGWNLLDFPALPSNEIAQ